MLRRRSRSAERSCRVRHDNRKPPTQPSGHEDPLQAADASVATVVSPDAALDEDGKLSSRDKRFLDYLADTAIKVSLRELAQVSTSSSPRPVVVPSASAKSGRGDGNKSESLLTPPIPTYVSPADVREALRCSKSTAYQLVRRAGGVSHSTPAESGTACQPAEDGATT